jgi:hypothetical protein
MGGPLPSNLSGEGRVWARERSLAEAHDCKTNSVKGIVHTISGFTGSELS